MQPKLDQVTWSYNFTCLSITDTSLSKEKLEFYLSCNLSYSISIRASHPEIVITAAPASTIAV